MRNRTKRRGALALLMLLGLMLPCAARTAASAPSVADMDADSRASGNRLDIARAVGDKIFATEWPAQVLQVSANQLDTHVIVGLRVSGVKFHQPLTRAEFTSEIVELVTRAFAASNAEEVDLWTVVPIDVAKGTVVSGDLAKPSSAQVFTLTAMRGESVPYLTSRIGSGTGVFWDQDWARTAFKQGT